MNPPRFLLAPDQENSQLYLLCTHTMTLIWITHDTPAKLFIVLGEPNPQVLLDAAEFWRTYAASQFKD
jgi:hypothetical protein